MRAHQVDRTRRSTNSYEETATKSLFGEQDPGFGGTYLSYIAVASGSACGRSDEALTSYAIIRTCQVGTGKRTMTTEKLSQANTGLRAGTVI
jgi:hypothetical protein